MINDASKSKFNKCLWEKLNEETRPILLYGTGNGGDKIIDVLEKYGITLSGVFASGGFVRDRYFRGFKVKSLEECEKEFGDSLVVLLAFGTTVDEVWENIEKIAKKHTLYIPEVPLFGDGLWNDEYFAKNRTKIAEAASLFTEERSAKLFDSLVSFRLSGDIKYLTDTENPRESYEIFKDCDIKTVIDCGAYRGDSADDIITALCPETVIAVEADRRTHAKLVSYAEGEKRATVIPVHAAVGEADGKATVKSTAGRSSGTASITHGAKSEEVDLITVNTLAEKYGKIDLIKYDVEGDEWKALQGSLETIKKDRPCLAVSVYHRTDDLWKLPLYIKEILPESELYLRRAHCLPDWDIVLFVKVL